MVQPSLFHKAAPHWGEDLSVRYRGSSDQVASEQSEGNHYLCSHIQHIRNIPDLCLRLNHHSSHQSLAVKSNLSWKDSQQTKVQGQMALQGNFSKHIKKKKNSKKLILILLKLFQKLKRRKYSMRSLSSWYQNQTDTMNKKKERKLKANISGEYRCKNLYKI